MTNDDLLVRIVVALEQSGISSMLTGSFASAYYGHMRATQDVDLVILATEQSLRNFVHSLDPSTYYVDEEAALDALRSETQFNVLDRTTGSKVDLIIRKSRPFSVEEFARRRSSRYGPV